MRNLIAFLLLLISLHQVSAQEFPARPSPPRLINDFTGTLSQSEVGILENKLVATNDSSGVQVAVVMLSTLEGYPIDDYAFKLAQQWGIGQKDKNNGVLLLISVNERKIYIATGYGLEGVMPDALCRRIVDDNIRPYFKQQRYFEGIDEGTTQIMNLARGDYKASAPVKKSRKQFPYAAVIIIAVIFISAFFSRIRSASRYSTLNSIPFWAAWGLLNASQGRHEGNWRNFNTGSGGFGGFGGGSGGGGFGGFGGGSFGGGGAGGSW